MSDPEVYMPMLPAANSWLIVPQSRSTLEPKELSSHLSACRNSSTDFVAGLSIVETYVPSPLSVWVRPPRATVCEVSCQPPVLLMAICA